MEEEKEFIVKVDLSITAENEAEAIRKFREHVQNVEANVFEVKEYKR